MKDFFISYNSADEAWAEWIAWILEDAGYSVVIRAWDFRPGDNFILQMDRASQECRRTLLTLSPDYLRAGYPKAEWAAAFCEDPTGEKHRLLPVRVSECDVRGMLGAVGYVDLVGLTEEMATDKLLKAATDAARLKPEVRPQFPARAGRDRPKFPSRIGLAQPKALGPPTEPYPFLRPHSHPDTFAERPCVPRVNEKHRRIRYGRCLCWWIPFSCAPLRAIVRPGE